MLKYESLTTKNNNYQDILYFATPNPTFYRLLRIDKF